MVFPEELQHLAVAGLGGVVLDLDRLCVVAAEGEVTPEAGGQSVQANSNAHTLL